MFAAFMFANNVTLMRFAQVIVWKRVVEINEDLAMTAIARSTVAVSSGTPFPVEFL